MIYVHAGSIWVSWIHSYILKGRSVMEYPILPQISWALRKILKQRTLAQFFLQPDSTWRNPGLKFSASYAYDALRQRSTKVPWHRVIWFQYHIPRHSLISWLVILNRLPTRERLLTWGVQIDSDACLLCQNAVESRDHIFGSCNFSQQIWRKILQSCLLTQPFGRWPNILFWLSSRCKGKSLISIVLKVAWGAFCYTIWTERNNRFFGGREASVDSIYDVIVETVRLRLHQIGIYVGNDRVIHLMPPGGKKSKSKQSDSVECQNCGYRQQSGVIKTCLNCFLDGHSLYIYEYGVPVSVYKTKPGGTCCTSNSKPADEVIRTAMDLHERGGYGGYDLIFNNCESFAVYCKTGFGVSNQVVEHVRSCWIL